MSLKILVSGDAEGNLASLFKKVEAVNKKVGMILLFFLNNYFRISYWLKEISLVIKNCFS